MNVVEESRWPRGARRVGVFSLLVVLVILAVVRSHLATRLDSFTLDEAFHITAGAAYVQTRDFRLNPEHPPLVKLWIGAFVTAAGFRVSPYRPLLDKRDEREFVETDVYVTNDPERVQAQTRAAMFTLNALLLLGLALATWRLLGQWIAVAMTGYLVIDPTVAAHFPIAMTDLPLAFLSTTALVTAVTAFRSWSTRDAAIAAVALGCAFATKHSAVVTVAAVAVIGLIYLVRPAKPGTAAPPFRRLGVVAAVLAGAWIVLWAFYGFRFAESGATSEERFNRPLALKIEDVQSPLYRSTLSLMHRGRLVPRAYTWGFADTIRAGAEGRAFSILAFGRLYYKTAPPYFFPAAVAVKIPIGLLALSVIGVGLLVTRRTPGVARTAMASVGAFALLYLLALVGGSSYGGIRHALPLIPPLAMAGALAVRHAAVERAPALRIVVAVALIAAAWSAIPVMRPWEYYNEFVGGPRNAHRYFNDEGIDLSLRSKEMVVYYNQHLEPAGEIPYVVYLPRRLEWQRAGLDWVGNDPRRDAGKIFGPNLSGTFFIGAKELAPALWWDVGKEFRKAKAVTRFGTMFVYRGTFPPSRPAQSRALYVRGMRELYSPDADVDSGIEMLEKAHRLDPAAFFIALELGNQYLRVAKRDQARNAYMRARRYAPSADEIATLLDAQIARIAREPLAAIAPLRNPAVE